MITKSQSHGFTLIEAIVSTAVFAFVISSILGVYISTLQLDRKTRAQRAVTQNAQFITTLLTKEVRNGTIDYASYPGGIIPADPTDLYIRNEAGELDRFYPSNSGCTLVSPCDLKLTRNGSTTNLNSSSVKVTNFKLYVNPAGNPFTPAKNYNHQPYVTIVLELTNIGRGVTDTAKINLQTTFASRVYPDR